MGDWTVYIIRANDGTLYTGITTDMARRWQEHVEGRGGAKYFRGRKPERVVYTEGAPDRAAATKREIHIKQLSRKAKLALVSTHTGSTSLAQPGTFS